MIHSPQFRIRICPIVTVLAALGGFFCFQAANAEPTILAPIELPQATPTLPSLTPTDITPVNIGREQQLLRPGFTYYLFQSLPPRLWFNVTAETSQRYESNVFFSRTRYRSDYVYRVLPNITLGYELFKKINIYTNYFVIKDLFVGHHQLTFPTTQSLSLGFRRDFTINPFTNLQLDFQSRELWQTTGLHQADLIPGFTLTRFLTPHTIVYTNMMLQMRGRYYDVAPTREIDPFYTLGALHTKGSWMFSAVSTLVTNFRHPPFNDAIPNQSNNSIICDFEVSHPVPKLPYLVGFIRAEPIFNWNGKGVQGLSGMDFRLFSGVRMTFAKPTYNASMTRLKQQLRELNLGPAGQQPNASPSQSTPEPAPEAPPVAPSSTPSSKTPSVPPETLFSVPLSSPPFSPSTTSPASESPAAPSSGPSSILLIPPAPSPIFVPQHGQFATPQSNQTNP